MARHTTYLPAHVEALLGAMLDLQKDQHPGRQQSASAIIADALVTHATRLAIDHVKTHGLSPRLREKHDQLKAALQERGLLND